jgi:hypothetical protein
MDPTNLGNLDESDPKSVARLMKKMGKEMGEDTSEIEEAMMADSSADGEAIDQMDSL